MLEWTSSSGSAVCVISGSNLIPEGPKLWGHKLAMSDVRDGNITYIYFENFGIGRCHVIHSNTLIGDGRVIEITEAYTGRTYFGFSSVGGISAKRRVWYVRWHFIALPSFFASFCSRLLFLTLTCRGIGLHSLLPGFAQLILLVAPLRILYC